MDRGEGGAQAGDGSISRALLKELLNLSFQMAGGRGEKFDIRQVDQTLDKFFRTQTMVPLAGLRLEGELGRQTLDLKIPASNEALDLLIEPRIERGVLWDIWAYLKRTGLSELQGWRWEGGSPGK